MGEDTKRLWLVVLITIVVFSFIDRVVTSASQHHVYYAVLGGHNEVIYRNTKEPIAVDGTGHIKYNKVEHGQFRIKRQVNNQGSSLPNDVAQDVVDLHNHYRRLQNASNMEYMQWSDGLAELAQAWADNCHFEHGQADINTTYSYPIGQNLLATTSTTLTIIEGTTLWYEEIKDYNYDTNSCTGMCGHYTQVVWSASREVGCAIADCRGPNGITENHSNWTNGGIHMVCNYWPAGNVQGRYPYAVGSPCTQCSSGQYWCYTDLCRTDCTGNSSTCNCTNACQNCGILNTKDCTCQCLYGTRHDNCGKIADVCDENSDSDINCYYYPMSYCDKSSRYYPYMSVKCARKCGVCRDNASWPVGCNTTTTGPSTDDNTVSTAAITTTERITETGVAIENTTVSSTTHDRRTNSANTSTTITDATTVTNVPMSSSTDEIGTQASTTIPFTTTGGIHSTDDITSANGSTTGPSTDDNTVSTAAITTTERITETGVAIENTTVSSTTHDRRTNSANMSTTITDATTVTNVPMSSSTDEIDTQASTTIPFSTTGGIHSTDDITSANGSTAVSTLTSAASTSSVKSQSQTSATDTSSTTIGNEVSTKDIVVLKNTEKSGISPRAVAGIVIGLVILIFFIIILLVLLITRKLKSKKHKEEIKDQQPPIKNSASWETLVRINNNDDDDESQQAPGYSNGVLNVNDINIQSSREHLNVDMYAGRATTSFS